jgi:hypothetical protein
MSSATIQVQLNAILSDSSGPLEGETVDFYYGLSTASSLTSGGSAVTSSTGTASVTLSLATGVYNLEAAFAGTTLYAASQVEISFDVTSQAQTQLTESVTTPTPAGTATASGTLTANGSPLADEPVTVTLNSTLLATLTTDSTGAFSYELTSLSPGSYKLTVAFAGTAAYLPASQTTTIIVPGAPSVGKGVAMVAAVALVATVVVIGALAVRRRKH